MKKGEIIQGIYTVHTYTYIVKNCDKWDITRRNTRISPQTSIHTYFESRRLFGLGIIVFFWVVNSYFQRKDKNKTSTPGVELPINNSFQNCCNKSSEMERRMVYILQNPKRPLCRDCPRHMSSCWLSIRIFNRAQAWVFK